MKRYEIILWDVDGTLLNFLESQTYAIKEAFRVYDIEINDQVVERYSEINESYWKRLEKCEITKKDLLHARFEDLFTVIKNEAGFLSKKDTQKISEIPINDFQAIYQKNLGSVYFFVDNAYELCVKLKKDFKQYIVTNGEAWTQENKLRLSGLTDIVDDVFISEEIGIPKPNRQFFETCFSRIPQLEREKVIIIGDSLTSDILGGNNAGIKSCWYNPGNLENETSAVADYEIRNLWEAEEILWQRDPIKN